MVLDHLINKSNFKLKLNTYTNLKYIHNCTLTQLLF